MNDSINTFIFSKDMNLNAVVNKKNHEHERELEKINFVSERSE